MMTSGSRFLDVSVDSSPLRNNKDIPYSIVYFHCYVVGTEEQRFLFFAGFDECAHAQFNNCDPNADCTDLPEGFACTCKDGFVGNGEQCTGIRSSSVRLKTEWSSVKLPNFA